MLVDWAGDTINIVDVITGEVARAFLFVAVLPFSGAVFCHASMKDPPISLGACSPPQVRRLQSPFCQVESGSKTRVDARSSGSIFERAIVADKP